MLHEKKCQESYQEHIVNAPDCFLPHGHDAPLDACMLWDVQGNAAVTSKIH